MTSARENTAKSMSEDDCGWTSTLMEAVAKIQVLLPQLTLHEAESTFIPKTVSKEADKCIKPMTIR